MQSKEAEGALLNELEKFVSKCKGKYEPFAPLDRPKAFHDSIWGTYIFSPAEVSLIDSPILQRLRFIHQTGLAGFTFHGADHHRFAHSIGTTIVATKIAQSLNLKNPKYVEPPDMQTLRLAALLHDVGHGIFSHISEFFYKNHIWIRTLREQRKFAHAKPHELMSHFLIKTDSFKNLFKAIQDRHRIEPHIQKIDLDVVADLILGKAPPEKFYLAQIINGPFDADKLDYIARDSYYTGLKLAVDIERLLYVMDVRSIDQGGPKYIVGTISGSSTFEQILESKIQMHSCLYSHPKVRATDMMLVNFLRYLGDHGPNPQKNRPHRIGEKFITPVDYLRHSDFDFLNPNLYKPKHLKQKVEDFRQRKLPMKALVISNFTLENGLRTLLGLADESNWGAIQWQLQEEICSVVGINKPHLTPDPYDVIFDLPDMPMLNEAELTYLFIGKGIDPIRLSKLYPTSHDWLDTYNENKWCGYVFCPSADLQKEVGECAISVLESRYPEVKFKRYSIDLARHRDEPL